MKIETEAEVRENKQEMSAPVPETVDQKPSESVLQLETVHLHDNKEDVKHQKKRFATLEEVEGTLDPLSYWLFKTFTRGNICKFEAIDRQDAELWRQVLALANSNDVKTVAPLSSTR